jgi:hypothetical protein
MYTKPSHAEQIIKWHLAKREIIDFLIENRDEWISPKGIHSDERAMDLLLEKYKDNGMAIGFIVEVRNWTYYALDQMEMDAEAA